MSHFAIPDRMLDGFPAVLHPYRLVRRPAVHRLPASS